MQIFSHPGSGNSKYPMFPFDTDRLLCSRVDLTVANRVHLVEPHWSPMAEAQAVDRVHRIGQTQEVVVTRYIVSNTIETVCLGRLKLSESGVNASSCYIAWWT